LLKTDVAPVPVDEGAFDLVIQPGELGASKRESALVGGGRKVQVPPVCLLDNDELMDRDIAREALGLAPAGRYVLFSLGPGNLKEVSGIGHGLIRAFEAEGFQAVWARPPISVRDMELPAGVMPVSIYPLARYLRAFDAFVGAAGYNTCCEVVQAGIPSLLVPNEQLADDQARRAQMVANLIPAVVSACETDNQRKVAVQELLEMMTEAEPMRPAIPMNGAALAAEEILALASSVRRQH
jgi:UDP:flavonoid glycosyltransferase YjiC (YdhE family)